MKGMRPSLVQVEEYCLRNREPVERHFRESGWEQEKRKRIRAKCDEYLELVTTVITAAFDAKQARKAIAADAKTVSISSNPVPMTDQSSAEVPKFGYAPHLQQR